MHGISDAADAAKRLSPADLFGDLPLMRLEFEIKTDPDAEAGPPPFTGSAWRGLVGRRVQKLVCPFQRRPDCRACLIKGNCPYALLMEEENALPGLSDAPRGYVLSPSARSAKGRSRLSVTLFGACARFAPVVVMAVLQGRRVGLGKGRHKYEVAALNERRPDGSRVRHPLVPEGHVSPQGPDPLARWLEEGGDPPERLRVRLATPVRLRKKGRYLDRMDWAFFFGSLARRLEALNCLFSEGQPLGREGWFALKERFRTAGDIRERLGWRDLARYSGRQRQKVPMGGLVGEVTVERPGRVDLAWWRAAELVHVGKGVVMGLGRVEIV